MAEIFKWYCRKNLYVDYFDVQVEVVFLTSQGLWSHEHVNPIYLELDRYGYENENERSKHIDHSDKLAGGTNIKKRTKVYG